MATTYRKTAKGQSEIDTRAWRLAPRQRNLLILVDGRRSDEDLARLVAQDCRNALEVLAGQGFIELIAVSAPAREARPTEAAVVPPQNPQRFVAQRAEVVRAFTDLMGPAGEGLAIRMERATTVPELRALVEVARQAVAMVQGPAAAAAFGQRFLGPQS